MSEKRKGLFRRLLDPNQSPAAPSDAEVDRWLREDDPAGPNRSYGPAPQPYGQGPQQSGHAPQPEQQADDEDDCLGVEITELGKANPLKAAGLQVGDVITILNGRPTPTEDHLAKAFMTLSPGRPATITVTRGDKELTRVIMLTD